jgi:hypothetical protein
MERVRTLMVDSDTQLLLETIGIPNFRTMPPTSINETTLIRLFPLAVRNKVPILFLEQALKICGDSERLQDTYQTYLQKAKLFRAIIKNVATVLNQDGLDYALFKTIKPFQSFGADVDVILFNRQDFKRACSSLRKNSYKLAGNGAFSVTLDNQSHQMGVDLHLQISVSRLVYMDLKLLREHVTETNVNGVKVRTLNKPATFVTDATHSIYKEQLLTFSDFYTTISEILSMDGQQLHALANLANKAHASLSAKAVLMLTDRLVKIVFKRTIPQVTETAELIPVSRIEEKVIRFLVAHLEQHFKLPYAYSPLAVAMAFLAKVRADPAMRSSLAGQFMEVIRNMPYLLENALLHMKGSAD